MYCPEQQIEVTCEPVSILITLLIPAPYIQAQRNLTQPAKVFELQPQLARGTSKKLRYMPLSGTPNGLSSYAILAVGAPLFSWLIWPIEYTQPSAAGASSPPKMMSRPSLTLTAT